MLKEVFLCSLLKDLPILFLPFVKCSAIGRAVEGLGLWGLGTICLRENDVEGPCDGACSDDRFSARRDDGGVGVPGTE